MKSIFGKYNPAIDESIHILISLLVAYLGYTLGLDLIKSSTVFLVGLLLDLDHLFSSSIAKLLKIKNYKGTTTHGSAGYTIKILHGIDVAGIIGIILCISTKDALFGTTIFISLSLHELWDFIVYPHSAKELFLLTRARAKFRPGIRKNFTGLVFDNDTMKY